MCQREQKWPAEAEGAIRTPWGRPGEGCADYRPIVDASTMSTPPESGSPDSNLSATFRTTKICLGGYVPKVLERREHALVP